MKPELTGHCDCEAVHIRIRDVYVRSNLGTQTASPHIWFRIGSHLCERNVLLELSDGVAMCQ